MTLQTQYAQILKSAKGPFQPKQHNHPLGWNVPLSMDAVKEVVRAQRMSARPIHPTTPQTFAESMRLQYNKPLATHVQRAAKNPLVQDRIQLLHGILTVAKEIQEPVATLITEILCSPALRALEEDLQSSLGLSPDDLHATLEFLTHLLSPHAP